MKNLEKYLEKKAKWYIKNGESFELFVSEMGWEEWMSEYCENDSDGQEISEKDERKINEKLKEAWVIK